MEPALLELYAEGVPDDEVAVILRLTNPAVIPDGVRIVARFGLIATCRVRRGDIPRLWAERAVESVKRPRPYGPTLDEFEDLAEIDAIPRPSDVRRPDGLWSRGKNVVIAHIDWGVDPKHDDFRNDDGSTRLLAIWDQAAPVDPGNPNPYGYGRIHRQADINRALATPDPYAALGYWPAASDPAGIGSHGAHTLGISAGNGRSGGPVGLAPDADLIFVHFSTSTAEGPVLLGDSVAFLEAMDFIAKVANGRPLVINASLGRQCGQHDGQTLTELGMDAFLRAADGRCICFSGGNYYARDMHHEDLIRPGELKVFRFQLDASYGGSNEIDLWYPGVDRFGVAVIAPDGSRVSAGPDGRAVVTVGGRAVGRLYHRIGDPNNGDNQVSLFLEPSAPRDVWQVELNGIDVADGRFHAWIERTAGGARRHARFLPQDIDRTCTTGTICNGHWTIATGAYDGHQASRPLARFSSSGPTRDGRPKPDLLAPGVRVLSARSHPRNATGDESLLTRMSGTSMAAPHVAGTVALMFAAAPRPLSVAETRRLLLGSVDPPTAADGNERWRMGSGFLNTRAAVEAAASLAGLGEAAEPAESEPAAGSAIVMATQAEATKAVPGETASADETTAEPESEAEAIAIEVAPEDIEMVDESSGETVPDETATESEGEEIAIENLAKTPEPADERSEETAPSEAAAESDAETVTVEAASEEIDEADLEADLASEDLAEDLEADWPSEQIDELTDERADEQSDEQVHWRDQEQDGETADVFAGLEEASMAKKRSHIRRHRRAGGSALPFQVQVPLTGGSPGLAFPLGGGAGSPFAFTVPLGGTPAPQPQPVPQPAPQPAMPAPMAAAPVAEPAGDAPVVVAGDVPLYEPPTGEYDEAEWIGEDILEAADEAAMNDDGRRLSSSALLQNLVQSGLGTDDPIALSPLGAGRPGPSATALFRALAYADDTGWRNTLQRHYRSRFAVLARPGEPCSVMPRPGDLLIRSARGEGWATLAVVASPGLFRHHELPSLGLRAEGYPRVGPGLYVHVVEPGPRPYPAAARFARRLGDIGNSTLGDTLLLRVRPSGAFDEAEPEATLANGVPAKELRSGASGGAVREVQAQLNRVHADLLALGLPGLDGGPLTEDGRFTARMERMVQSFQQTVFTDPSQWDGIVRADTLAELRKLTGANTAPAAIPAAPLFPPAARAPASETEFAEAVRSDPAFIRWIQESLNRVLSAGLTADGRMGPRTRAAIRAFQQRAGLTADGVVGSRTEAALAAAVGGGQTPPAPTPPAPVPPSPTPPSPTPAPSSDEGVDAFATRLGAEWSRRKGGRPSAEEKRDQLLRDYEDTLQGAGLRFGTRYSEDAIRRAWMISREDEMRFQTELSGGPLGDFGPPARKVPLVSDASIGGSDKAPVAPIMVRFVAELRRRYGANLSVGTYRGHGGGSFNDQGYSLDLFLRGTDARGFYRPDDAIRLLRAVNAAAQAMPAKWRIIYNDFAVADAMNRETGQRNVIFVGGTRKDRNGRVTGLNWHGPAPLILHFHLDLAPQPGAEGEAADEAWAEDFSESELEEVLHACEGETEEVAVLEGLLEGEEGADIEADFAEGSGPTFVRWIQASLNRVMNAGLTEDGQMGPRTRAAIRAFQQRAGLVADGIVGPRTEAALQAALGGSTGPSAQAVVCRGIAAREVIDRFEFNHPEMPASGQPTIDNIAACIAESRRGSDPIRTIRLVGHTDPVGSDTDNDRLGTNRANSVRDALRTALHGHGIADADVVINVETRGERDLVPGDPALSRRVEIFPPRAFTPTAAAAQIEVVLDDNNDTIVDAAAPVTTFVRFGLWDQGYDAAGNVRNGQAEAANFIGQDRRRFYLRVRDPAATTQRVNATWKTLRADGRTDDDAPASQAITLTETASGSRVYVSKAIMLVTDDTDANQPTHSGLSPPLADATIRNRGQSNHRLRRASMNGFLFAQYVPASGTAVNVTLPVFVRTPNDERRRVRVRVINYNTSATAAYIAGQFEHANLRWNQIGLAIQAQTTANRPAPAGVIGVDGTYAGSINNAPETAALNDLVPITPNNTVTAVFVPLSGANAYATIGERTTVALGDRYFIFIDDNLSLNDETLAHELAHVLFNRFDAATARRFYTLNTNPPSSFGVPLPDPRIYRRIQNQHNANPDNDAPNDNIINWAQRRRGARFPIGGGLDAPTATTGNKLTETL